MATFDRGHALVIGVGADLPNTVDDAAGLADILRDPERCAYPPDQVHLLTGEDATREAVLAALDRLAQAADAQSTVVVYYSGHGYRVAASTGEAYYLMPYGYDVQQLYRTAVSGVEFAERLRSVRAQKLLVLLDCCHAGGVGESKAPGLELSKSPLPPEAQRLLAEGSGRVLIASSQEDEKSYAGKPYSAFTLALVEALSGTGVAKQDGYVRVTDLALHAREVVPRRTRGKQHPILHFEQADNFALAYYAGGETAPKGPPFTGEPEIEPEPGAWAALDQRGQTVQGSQTNITGDTELSGDFQGPVAVGGDAVDLSGSQGAVYKPSGPVEQYLGPTQVTQTRIGDVSGQVAVGDGNVQTTTIGTPAPLAGSRADQDLVDALLNELKTTVAAAAPADKQDAALERLDEFAEALTEREPDLATMEYVQSWFNRQVPALGEAISAILAHPAVRQRIAAAGDTIAAEFRRRFDL
jgi:hypothetical protein